MSASAIVAASCLAILAAAHSFLGEKALLQPLFKQAWKIDEPRWAVERIFRFAWHLTSIAWLGLGAVALGASIHLAIAAVGLGSAAIIFFTLRGHLAWPLFALAGLAGLHSEGWLPAQSLGALVGVTLAVIGVIATIHVYWIVGGRWGITSAIPSNKDGVPAFSPPAWVTGMVVAALGVFGSLMAWVWLGEPNVLARVLLGVGCAVMVFRAIGDGKHIGFSKQFRGSSFAVWDDRLFTPLAVLMAFGSGAALLV